MSHLFFSYANHDYDRLAAFHQQLELRSERLIWIDRIGLQRDVEWEEMIHRAIDSSYGVIFAITETFNTRPFILEKEIPWTTARFNDSRQGKLIFALRFDDVPLPPGLQADNIRHVLHVINVFDRDWDEVIAELIPLLPPVVKGGPPFVVSWPRLRNFKGREQQLIDLNRRIFTEDGRVGIKTAGLYGQGGIGKTQLAVEYAYRYRFYFPAGVYWINAAADWQQEFATIADNLRLTPADPSDRENRQAQMVFALKEHLAAQEGPTLLVMDNVANPVALTNREVAPKLTVLQFCQQTNVRLIVTTRVQDLPEKFYPVEVTVLDRADSVAVLRDAWHPDKQGRCRTDPVDEDMLDAIADLFADLPLPLGWMAAALRQKAHLAPDRLLANLKQQGVDAIIERMQQAGVRLGTPEYYEGLVGAGLDWQLDQLDHPDARHLLHLIAAYGEAAIVPTARLRLLADFDDDDLFDPFEEAAAALTRYSLAEAQAEGRAYRLHPLTQLHLARQGQPTVALSEAALRLVTAYRTPEVFDAQIRARGFAVALVDLQSTQDALPAPDDDLRRLARLYTLESHRLLTLPEEATAAFVVQQVRDRAHHESDDNLRTACDTWLADKPHLRSAEYSRCPANPNLRRILKGHTDHVIGALELSDGRLLSWSQDSTLRLWDRDGSPRAVLEGHRCWVNGALELSDGRILSWAWQLWEYQPKDHTLRLWGPDGAPQAILEGHKDGVTGALELSDGRLLSWSGKFKSTDWTLRLWGGDGTPQAVLEGHKDGVTGALELSDHRILSWSKDCTLRLWERDGSPQTILESHTWNVQGALELCDHRILSWSFDHALCLWESDGSLQTILEGHTNWVLGALELNDHRILSWSVDGTLQLWEPEGILQSVLKGHMKEVIGALELSDHRLLSWSTDHTLRLWGPEGTPQAVLKGHADHVAGVLELSDHRILSWSFSQSDNFTNDRTLRLWGPEGAPQAVLVGHTSKVTGALELSDHHILSWSADGTLRLWKAEGIPKVALQGHMSLVANIRELHDGRILSWVGSVVGSSDYTLRLWGSDGRLQAVLEGHRYWVKDALELSDGRILSSDVRNYYRLWAEDGTALGSTSEEEMSTLHLQHWQHGHAPLERYWDCQGDILYHASAGQYVHDAKITTLAPSSEHRCVTGDLGGRVLVIEAVGVELEE